MNEEEKKALNKEMEKRGISKHKPDLISEKLEKSMRSFKKDIDDINIKKIVPSCKCGKGLIVVGESLVCPQCGEYGVEDDPIMSR